MVLNVVGSNPINHPKGLGNKELFPNLVFKPWLSLIETLICKKAILIQYKFSVVMFVCKQVYTLAYPQLLRVPVVY